MKEQADQARVSAGNAEKSKPDSQPTLVDSSIEARSLDTPPNPEYPSGIFSIIIVGFPIFYGETFANIFGKSNINNLENQNIMGRTGKSMKHVAGKPGQPTAEDTELEEHADLPNSYCEILVSTLFHAFWGNSDILY
jgi:hypothetical protein